MDPSLQPLLSRLDRLPEPFRELREGVRKAVLVAELDPEMALTRGRKVLELVVRELYERHTGEPAGTRPLENLLQRLVKEGHLPARLDAHANAVRLLGNVGTHGFGQAVTAADVQQSLSGLMHVLDWYVREEGPAGPGGQPGAARAPRPTAPEDRPGYRPAVVPKGLRSFDAGDAGFFLELLPGPRDEDGLPEGIRFWKHRAETAEPGFTVGVLYGPSGCGKSSLVKAGLLPRLAGHVLPVYVEAAGKGTEARLLAGLRRRCPDLPAEADLTAAVAALRQGQGLAAGRKVLLVLDQFEQFLHARRAEEDTDLARALRQCDGERVQALLLVRDDFWLALTRFMMDLNVDMIHGQNCTLVDLFDRRHARAVLAAFGRAFGTVDEPPSAEQEAFLGKALEGLAEDGRVVPVRLALFAEMVKGRPWTPATLKEVGGAAGVGGAFLEETFGRRAAQAKYRLHQGAARAVLRALLPEEGTDLKGQMQSRAKLLRASAYEGRPRDFEDLLRLLDGELRLITPTEPPAAGAEGERYYQLTHDYLVPALREWLMRRQRETWRGRAELRLAEHAAAWAARPEGQYLPAWCEWLDIRLLSHLPVWWEWLDIRLFIRPRDWTESQRRMMRRAERVHLARTVAWAALGAAVVLTGALVWRQVRVQQRRDRAEALVKRLLVADAGQVPGIIREMKDYRLLVNPQLRQELERQPEKSRERLHASLALLPGDPGQADYLGSRLLDGATPAELAVLRDALRDNDPVRARLWAVLGDERTEAGPRFRAACALAGYDLADAEAARWQRVAPFVAGQLVAAVQQDPASYPAWLLLLRPRPDCLTGPLETLFRNHEQPQDGRIAASILADYLGNRPAVLADLACDADAKQFLVLLPVLEKNGKEARDFLTAELAKEAPAREVDAGRVARAKRQGNAAAVLVALGDPDPAWHILKHSRTPDARTVLIHGLAPRGADPRVLIRQLQEEKDDAIRQALILALGEYAAEQLPQEARANLTPRLLAWYRDDPSAGVHGAIDWLLRHDKEGPADRPLKWGAQQDLARIDATLAGKPKPTSQRWYVTGQGQTFTTIRGPFVFQMGSPESEPGRLADEVLHRRSIGRSFAIATKPVTVAQWEKFMQAMKEARLAVEHSYPKQFAPEPDCPVVSVTWYEAAMYCRWLSEVEQVRKEQMVYPTIADILKCASGQKPLELPQDYLARAGYRLPTEAEFEYACRADTATRWCFGAAEEFLPRHAWFLANSQIRAWPTGQKMPNELGLFDTHGNAWTWCQGGYRPYNPAGMDDSHESEVSFSADLVQRGGSFESTPARVRCAFRSRIVPLFRDYNVGFRPARTLPADDSEALSDH